MSDPHPQDAKSRIDLAEEPDFDLGRMRVRPAERAIEQDGRRQELQPRVMQVLVCLAKARPAVVSRDRLIDQCWDGRIVGDDALNRCILALRHLAEQSEPRPFAIETVSRVGHRLIEQSADRPGLAGLAARMRSWRLWAAAAALVLALAGGQYVWQHRRAPSPPASIAVLPFRNLAAGDTYFAEGVGEEILTQLSREPQFRVVGRQSSAEFGTHPDVRAVAEQLGIEYVLEGSVRKQGNRVRVSADLVRGRDGARLWSNAYDGKLDDIFSIQQRVGIDIAAALRRRLIGAPALSGSLVTNGEAYNLYLTARGLIRTRNRKVIGTASNLLRDAIKLDPNYAPAWAALAESVSLDPAGGSDGLVAALPRAEGYARHALQLAPELASAHAALGGLLPMGSPGAAAHLRRAVALDPGSAANWIALGPALAANGEFERELDAYRRASALDPLWFRTTGALSIGLAGMGRRAEAEAAARRGLAHNEANKLTLLGRIAWIMGDYSEAARCWSIVARSNSPRWSFRAREALEETKLAVGLTGGSSPVKPIFRDARHRYYPQDGGISPNAVWEAHTRSAVAASVYRDLNHLAAKQMLNAGRSAEITATYDGPTGLFGIRRGVRLRVDQLHEVAVVALALGQAHRQPEADRLLNQANSLIAATRARGAVPFAFDADAAGILAVQGRSAEALAMLEQAMARGWTHADPSDLADLALEPAFRPLVRDARFVRIKSALVARLAQERADIVAQGV